MESCEKAIESNRIYLQKIDNLKNKIYIYLSKIQTIYSYYCLIN